MTSTTQSPGRSGAGPDASRSPLLPQTGLAASTRRIRGMVRRHWYVIATSGPRMLDMIFWPMVSMLMWGFLQTHLAKSAASPVASAAGLLVGGVLLWDILLRSQLGFSLAFLEELWSRNLGHLMMSPLRPIELIGSLVIVSFLKMTFAMVPVALLAYVFFNFSVLSLGFAFVAFFANLVVMSWCLGLISVGSVLRWGMGAENIAWLIVFLLLPVSCVYYPVATLPGWLQPVALALPSAHVFEGLRAVVLEGRFATGHMLAALALNSLFLCFSYGAFHLFLEDARRKGALAQMGE